jgi:hypothetical protein
MRKQIYRIYTETKTENEVKSVTFETADKDEIKYYKMRGATIVKTGSFVIVNNCR